MAGLNFSRVHFLRGGAYLEKIPNFCVWGFIVFRTMFIGLYGPTCGHSNTIRICLYTPV